MLGSPTFKRCSAPSTACCMLDLGVSDSSKSTSLQLTETSKRTCWEDDFQLSLTGRHGKPPVFTVFSFDSMIFRPLGDLFEEATPLSQFTSPRMRALSTCTASFTCLRASESHSSAIDLRHQKRPLGDLRKPPGLMPLHTKSTKLSAVL